MKRGEGFIELGFLSGISITKTRIYHDISILVLWPPELLYSRSLHPLSALAYFHKHKPLLNLIRENDLAIPRLAHWSCLLQILP